MIHSIEISDCATFLGKHSIAGLKAVNFFFGSNGTGKTTISKGIACNGSSPKCTLKWEAGLPLEVMVYNKDFVDANLSHTEELNGIFTLGEEEIDLAAKIEEQNRVCDRLRADIMNLTKSRDGDPDDSTFEGQRQKLEKLESSFREECWGVKAPYDAQFREVLKGNLKKDKFRDRTLLEYGQNTCTAVDAATLAERVQVVFGSVQEVIPTIPRPSFARVIGHENASILSKIVVGKNDVDVAALIEKLGNSDWVKQGVTHLEKSAGKCPFCQEDVPETLRRRLEAYFDETFLADTKAIGVLCDSYANDVTELRGQLGEVEQNTTKYLNLAAFRKECQVIELLFKGNLDTLHNKQLESSRAVTLDGMADASNALLKLIDTANDAINKHNELMGDLVAKRKSLEAEVWRFLLDAGLKKVVEEYKKKKGHIDKAVEGLSKGIGTKKKELERAIEVLKDLERKTTSVEPTVNDINKLLSSFGFRGFSLAIGTNKSTYRLVRPNGESAKNTLSEGEKTFVTFLYFYHMLKGSKDAANVSASRIVVFDDPVSSLDSDVLHIVSSLIKRLFEDVCAKQGVIKQLFILTHNNYFHKEVSYIAKQRISPYHVTYWEVYKRDGESGVMLHRTNPVKSSYHMLWTEIARRKFSVHTIQNTMRRILEQSAKLLGGISLDEIENAFSGVELGVCRSLMAWVHDGSHFCHDDICMSADATTVEVYLNVFKLIFERCGHGKHYRMMMEHVEPEIDGEKS